LLEIIEFLLTFNLELPIHVLLLASAIMVLQTFMVLMLEDLKKNRSKPK
jgi:hypothetical protein